MHTTPVLNFQDFISADGDQLYTTSNKIAAAFGKRHDNVLRDICELITQLPEEDRRLNFELVMESMTYKDSSGLHKAMETGRVSHYIVSRDGFTLLAMGFTGKKALAFKLAYIKAFNAMAAYIKNQREGIQFQFLRKELEYKDRKIKVSASARDMRQWRDEKPTRLEEMRLLLDDLQPSLLPQ